MSGAPAVVRPSGRRRAGPGAGRALGAALVALLGLAGPARADDQNGSLGAAASATDYYRVSCFDDGNGVPASLTLQIRDVAPSNAPKISAQVRVGAQLVNTTDSNDADGAYSPLVRLNGGAAVYDVLVDKSAAGTNAYQIIVHCYSGPDGTGLHTGTGITIVQSQ